MATGVKIMNFFGNFITLVDPNSVITSVFLKKKINVLIQTFIYRKLISFVKTSGPFLLCLPRHVSRM